MGLLSDNFIADSLLLTTAVAVIIWAYFNNAYKYWQKRNIAFLPPKFPLGNSDVIFTKNINFGLETVPYYQQLKKMGCKFGGIYTVTRPVLIAVDPDFIRDILSKDFQYFIDRGVYYNEKDDPISAHLFALDERHWKSMRSKLTPTFTTSKMKMMFQSIADISDRLIGAIDKSARENKDIDIREFLIRFTTDVIGCCAFGIDCDTFKDPRSRFRRMADAIFQINSVTLMIKLILINKMPELCLKMGLVATRKDVSEFYHKIVDEAVRYREKNDHTRPDFLQTLIDLKNETKDTSDPFTMGQLVAQVFVFFLAGSDTSSTTMTFAIYELCRNPDIQEKARIEINEVLEKHGWKFTYESVHEMKYLQQIVDETQRLYPPLVNLSRVCIKDYKVRDSNVTIEKGTQVVVPLAALHRDPDYYPDPDKFDPERFSAENKSLRHPYVHLPFGEGPRNCIGIRFGLMQSKIGLAMILRKFRLSISPSTKMPLHLDQQLLLLRSIEQLYIIAEKI